MLNDNCLRMQKILDKVLPAYLDSKSRYMCTTLKEAWLEGEITWEDYKFATKEIDAYLKHLGPYETLEVALQDARLNCSQWHREQIYHNWVDRPMTSPALERWWITKALSYGKGIWQGLKIAEDAGYLTCTQVGIVKYSIGQFGREPTRRELKNWTTVKQQN